jgi:hypothetical protein
MADSKDRTNPFLSKTAGKGDTGSRKKAEKASEQANEEIKQQEKPQAKLANLNVGELSAWPLGSKGTPMMHAEMAASELIPTGQYANVTVGPCRVHFLIDPDRELRDDEDYFTPQQRATIAKALNESAEIVEADVVAVQRNIVMESMQGQQD